MSLELLKKRSALTSSSGVEFWVNYAKTGSLEESLKVNQYSWHLRAVYISGEKCKQNKKQQKQQQRRKMAKIAWQFELFTATKKLCWKNFIKLSF